MRQIAFSILISTLLFSCKQEVKPSTTLKAAIAESLALIKSQNSRFVDEVRRSGNEPDQLLKLRGCQSLTDFKTNYLKSKSYNDLLVYSDSVQHWYQRVFTQGGEVGEQIAFFDKLVRGKPDSVNSLYLFFWTLQAEEAILEIQSEYPELACNLKPDYKPIEVFFNQNSYFLTDTVNVSFDLGLNSNTLLQYHVDLKDLKITHRENRQWMKPLVINMKPLIMIQFNPVLNGDYQIHGKIIFKHITGREFLKQVDTTFVVN